MMQLPGRISVPTARLLALLELAEWGVRSAAERVLVSEMQGTIQETAQQFAAQAVSAMGAEQKEEVKGQVDDEGDQRRFDGGAEGTEPAGAGDGDGGGAGAERRSAGGGVVGGSE